MLAFQVQAHPGRTDGSGGHTCKTNCPDWGLDYDEYHKHNSRGGYTNSLGQEFDKTGSLIQVKEEGITKEESEIIIPLEPEPQPLPEPDDETIVIFEEGDDLPPESEILEEVTSHNEVEPQILPVAEVVPSSPTPEPPQDDKGVAGAALATIAILGGGGYYAYKKIRKK